jgi:hypothetical protein
MRTSVAAKQVLLYQQRMRHLNEVSVHPADACIYRSSLLVQTYLLTGTHVLVHAYLLTGTRVLHNSATLNEVSVHPADACIYRSSLLVQTYLLTGTHVLAYWYKNTTQ